MTTACRHIDLAIEVPRREVLRYLGYRRSARPSRQVASRIETLWHLAEALIEPAGLCRIASGAEAAAAGMPRPTQAVGIGLCTIGPRLEAAIQEQTGLGRPLDALVLDAYGSAAAEATADALERELASLVGALGLTPRSRISPGYGTWDVACQTRLLALLPMAELGISLTEGCMMVPRKSVSFAVRCVHARARAAELEHRCDVCGAAGCSFRDHPSPGSAPELVE